MFECSKCNRSIGQSVRACRHRKQGECPVEVTTGKLDYPKGQALLMACSGLLFVYFTLSITSAFKDHDSAGTLEVVFTIGMVSLFLVVGGIVALIGLASLFSKRFIYVDRVAENQATIITLRGFDYAFEAVTSLRLVRFSGLQLFGSQQGGTVDCSSPGIVARNKEALRAAIQHLKAGEVSQERVALVYEAAHDAFLNALSGVLFRGLATGKVGDLRVSGEERLSSSSREILLLTTNAKLPLSGVSAAAVRPHHDETTFIPPTLSSLENAIVLKLSRWETAEAYEHSKLGPNPILLFNDFGSTVTNQSIEIVELALRDASFSGEVKALVSAWDGFTQLYPRLAQSTSRMLKQELGLIKVKSIGLFARFSWTSFRSGFFAALFVLCLLTMYFQKVGQAQKAGEFISHHAGNLTKEASKKLAGKSIKLEVPDSRSAKLQASLNGLFDALTPDLKGTETDKRLQHYKSIIKRDFSSAAFQREYAHYRKLFSKAFASTNESVRLSAVRTLAAVEGNAAEITELLEQQLARDPSPVVREAISEALEERGVGGFTSAPGEGLAAGAEGSVNDLEDYVNENSAAAIESAESTALDEVQKLLDE
jgi:hypothetical protein